MKRILITLVSGVLALSTLSAQNNIKYSSEYLNIPGVLKNDVGNFKAGTPLTLLRFVTLKNVSNMNGSTRQIAISVDGVQTGIPFSNLPDIELTLEGKNGFWVNAQIQSGLVSYYQRKGMQESVRNELAQEADTYLDELNKANLIYEDATLEDYIHCLMLDILPDQMVADRKEALYIRILKSPNPDIMMLANNCLLISSGLLTTLDSEEELFSILTREITHYVLDHAILTINRNNLRIARTEFWSVIANVAAIALEEHLDQKFENYTPGFIFAGNHIIQTLVNEDIYDRMGLTYSAKQEEEADRITLQYLQLLKKDPAQLTSALQKIEQFYADAKDSKVFERHGILGSLGKRLEKLQKAHPANQLSKDTNYLMRTSALVSFSAAMMEYNGDYSLAVQLAQKNIGNRMVSPEDYLVLTKCIMKKENTEESRKECHALLDKATSLMQSPSPDVIKQRILLLLRENRRTEAAVEVTNYENALSQIESNPHSADDEEWLAKEYSWIRILRPQLQVAGPTALP